MYLCSMQRHVLEYNQPLRLESGSVLPGIQIAYHTYGKLDPARNNTIWICHAFTANSNPSEWWDGLVGEDKYFNPRDHFVVCVNMLGSCYGTTGPLSVNPSTGKPWYGDFPLVTIRDIVRVQQIVREHLGIQRIRFAVGFSMGGQKLLEWAYEEPELFDCVLLGATNARHSPWGIAFNESQRMAIAADPTFGEPHEKAGLTGMGAARSIGLISYRNYRAYCRTQAEPDTDKYDQFKASTYQQYQAKKLQHRFNAYSYWTLSKAMDSHNIARSRGSVEDVLSRCAVNAHLVAIASDYLFPLEEQEYLQKHLPNADMTIIDSDYGHDGFLIEYGQLEKIIRGLLEK